MINNIVAVFRGLVLNPLLVAFARGMAEAAAMAAILVAAEFFAGPAENIPDALQTWAPLITLALRQLEGLADKIDPAKARRRDALREEGAAAEITDGAAGPLNPGDVRDPAVDAAIESYNNGDFT